METGNRDRFPYFYATSTFWRFVAEPVESTTFKLFFDNGRNYVIAASVLAAGRYYRDRMQQPVAGWPLLAVGLALTVLNGLQLWVLFLRTFYQFFGLSDEELYGGGFRGLVGSLKIVLLGATPAVMTYLVWHIVAVFVEKAAP